MGARTGQRFGAYTVGAHVADGSMGAVYQASHDETDERVAIKILHPDVARDQVAAERFRREYETAKSLDHPHIIDVHDFGETNDRAEYMTMEFLEGEELSLVLNRDGPMKPPRTLRLVCQIALALQHAHADGVIHRDLKPDNIFVCSGTTGDDVRILDFGSVKLQVETGPKLTMIGTTLGSPYYMSPEQAMGRADIDPRTDLFALAAIMHELGTGEVAFDGEKISDILTQIISHDPPPVSIANQDYPWAFDGVVRKGLRKDKEERFSSCIDLAEDMLAAFGLEPDVERWAQATTAEIEKAIAEAPAPSADVTPSPPPTPDSRFPSELPIRDNRGAKLVAGLVLLGALLFGIWLVLS